MINLILLKELEACRDLNEAYEFLKSREINCTKADLLNLKNEYNNKFNNENKLTLKQLNNVAGGLVLRTYESGRKELLSDKTSSSNPLGEYHKEVKIDSVSPWNVFKNMYLLSHLDKSEIASMTEDEKKLVNTMQKSKDNFTLSAQIGAIGLFAAELATACVFICSSSNNNNNLNNNK